MKKRTIILLLFYPIFIMAGYSYLSNTLIQYFQLSFNVPPVFVLMGTQVLFQGSTLLLLYRSFIYKHEKNYRTLLGIMTLVCILLYVLAIKLFIPFELYTIFPYLITYYGSAFVYSLWGQEAKKL